MDVLLQQVTPPQQQRRVGLRSGQYLTIGASQRADVPVKGDPGLPGECARLEVRGEECLISDISGVHGVVVVNGVPTHRATLENGDTIRIGTAEFSVEWEVTPSEPEVPVVRRDYSERRLQTKVRQLVPSPGSEWPLAEVIEQICQNQSPLLMINYRASGREVPSWATESEDLFSQTPDEVRQEHSMHVISGLPWNEMLNLYAPLASANCATWAFHTGDAEQVLSDAKLYLAWFARPSILQMNLEQASESFLDGLLKPFTGFCFRPTSGEQWALYTQSDRKPTDFGFATDAVISR